MPITMHAVGWRVVASAALDEAAAGDEAVAIVRVGCRAVGSASAAMGGALAAAGRYRRTTATKSKVVNVHRKV